MDQVFQHPYDQFREPAEAKLDWNYKVKTNMEPTALFVETEGKDYCSSGLELGFQERFDRRAMPDIEPQLRWETQETPTECQSIHFYRPSFHVPRYACLRERKR